MTTWLYNFFDLEAHDTTVGAGFLCSTTTFLTLSYIIFVQPVLLSAAGMELGAVLTAT
jgi:AGZA family xanthine/uracil permease-like MFS transporter